MTLQIANCGVFFWIRKGMHDSSSAPITLFKDTVNKEKYSFANRKWNKISDNAIRANSINSFKNNQDTFVRANKGGANESNSIPAINDDDSPSSFRYISSMI